MQEKFRAKGKKLCFGLKERLGLDDNLGTIAKQAAVVGEYVAKRRQ